MGYKKLSFFLFLYFFATYSFSQEVIFKENGFYGLKSKGGKIISHAAYDSIKDFSNGFYIVYRNGLCGYLGEDGTLSEIKFTWALPFGKIYGAAFINNKDYSQNSLFVIDKKGKIIHKRDKGKCTFREKGISVSYGGILSDKHHEFIDINGKLWIHPKYNYHDQFGNYLIASDYPNNYWIVDKNGKRVLPFFYSKIESTEGNSKILVFSGTGTWGAMNKKLKWVVPPDFDQLNYHNNIFTGVRHDTLYIFKKYSKKSFVLPVQKVIYFPERGKKNLLFITNIKGKAGVLDEKGKIKIPFEYDAFLPEYGFSGKIVAVKNNKFGVIDSSGNSVIPFEYDELKGESVKSKSYFLLRKGDSLGLADANGNILAPVEHSAMWGNFQRYFPVHHVILKKNGKYGFFNFDSARYFPPQYDSLAIRAFYFEIFHQGRHELIDNNNKVVFPLNPGERLVDVSMAEITNGKRFFCINKDSMYHLYDEQRNILFSHSGIILAVWPSYIKVQQEGLQWIYSWNGEKKISEGYRHIDDGIYRNEKTFTVYKGSERYIIDSTGKIIIGKNVPNIKWTNFYLSEGYYVFHSDSCMSLWDDSLRKEIIPCKYKNIWFDKTIGHWLVSKDGLIGMLDKKLEKEIIPLKYDEVKSFSQKNRLLVKQGLFWGIVDYTGKEIIKCINSERIEPIGRDYFLVTNYANESNIADSTGELLYPKNFWRIAKENPNRYKMIDGPYSTNCFFIDSNLKVLNIPKTRWKPISHHEGYYFSLNMDKVGVEDETGNIIIPPVYKRFWEFGSKYFFYEENGKLGFMDIKGNKITDSLFDKLIIGGVQNGVLMERDKKMYFVSYEGSIKEIGKYELNQEILKSHDGLYGIMDRRCKILVEPQYSSIQRLRGGYYWVCKHSVYGIIDKWGNIIVDFKYHNISDLGNAINPPYYILSWGQEKYIFNPDTRCLVPKNTYRQDFTSRY